MNQSVLALIPARGGSSRIPRKNLKNIGEKPMIAHTVEQSLHSESIDETVVSTDDAEIIQVAEDYGARVPFKRPAELATNTATTNDVVEHALNWLENNGESYDIIVLLQVTSPFRQKSDIESGIELLQKTSAEAVISISEYETPPQWAVSESDDGFLESHYDDSPLWSERSSRSQDLQLNHPNGALFLTYVSQFKENKTFYADRTKGYKMPRERSIDIDEPLDLRIAQAIACDDK